MQYQDLSDDSSPVHVEVSRFASGSGVEELHLMLSARNPTDFASELAVLERAYRDVMDRLGGALSSAVFRRVFLSDAANQVPAMSSSTLLRPSLGEGPVAISVVEQPPLPRQRIALWAYHVVDPAGLRKRPARNGVIVDRPAHRHLWLGGLVALAGAPGAEQETAAVLEQYSSGLGEVGGCLADHALRTWFYVQNVDLNYAAMVAARKQVFARHGLTAETHYLASTGIEGRGFDVRNLIRLDAYGVTGLLPRQVRFLAAPEHLGPTDVYGVTFERGTQVDYGDRSHAIISGTASIEPGGRSLHLGDAAKQAGRACANMEALLADAGMGPADIAQAIVYLRDGADAPRIAAAFRERYPGTPSLFVRAPVCRPEWLVEVECLATRANAADLPAF